jgi:Gram-negative bacterial TonB protein C-terminal
MSSEALSTQVSGLVGELFDQTATPRWWSLVGWGVALGGHVLAASLALSEVRPVAKAPPPVEVELAPPAPQEPPKASEPPPAAPAAAVAAPRAPAQASRAAAAPPEPARAAALLTAKADPEPSAKSDEPVDFTNDPSVVGFGSGVVAVGGKAQVGLAGARLVPSPAAATSAVATGAVGDALVPAGDLSQKPSLGEADPCRGYFPSAASDDAANASVLVTIAKTGAVTKVQLLSESPPGQGFGAAARTCMSSKRFTPGLDRDGNRAATSIRVNIRFLR